MAHRLLTPGALRDRHDAGSIRLIDVRTPAEFETSHIPGAYNVPLEMVGLARTQLAQLPCPIVVVCQSGVRADKAATQLAELAGAEVHVLEGGMSAWEAAGHPVRRGRARWSLERQVRLVAGSIVATSVVASVVVPKAKWLGAAIGAGLVFAAVSNTCAMGELLARLPYNRGDSCDVDSVLAELRSIPTL